MKTILAILVAAALVLAIGSYLQAWTNEGAENILELLPSGQAEQAIEYNVSAYCPCSKCCGKWADGITASGSPAVGFLVAAPPNIPYGTMIAIPGYNDGLPVPVLDRGGAIKGNKLDLLFPSHQAALNWGRQRLVCEVGL